MSVLAIDLGRKRVGIALNPTGSLVIELPTLSYQSTNALIAQINELIVEHEASLLVIGKIREGQELETILAEMADKLDVPIEVIDETLTTKEAERQLGAEGKRGDSDARAAKIILEDYLASRSKE